MAGTNKSFGALSFKHHLRNYILGCNEVIPQPKNSNISADSVDDQSGFADITGFEKCTKNLVEPQKTKGKVVVASVMDAEDEILDYDGDEPLHFETDVLDTELESNFFLQCGRHF